MKVKTKSKSLVKTRKKSSDITDAEAALMASQRKQGGGNLYNEMMHKKIKYVHKVFTLRELRYIKKY